MKKFILTFAAACVFLCAPLASAVPMTMQFTASGFSPSPAPTDPVSGTIKYDAAPGSPNAPVTFTSIDLTIAGHTYSLGEIGFMTDGANPNRAFIGVPAIGTLTPNTNDFALVYFLDSLQTELFAYSFAGQTQTPLTFITRSNVSVRVTADAANVPEPASGALLGFALGTLALARRWRRAA